MKFTLTPLETTQLLKLVTILEKATEVKTQNPALGYISFVVSGGLLKLKTTTTITSIKTQMRLSDVETIDGKCLIKADTIKSFLALLKGGKTGISISVKDENVATIKQITDGIVSGATLNLNCLEYENFPIIKFPVLTIEALQISALELLKCIQRTAYAAENVDSNNYNSSLSSVSIEATSTNLKMMGASHGRVVFAKTQNFIEPYPVDQQKLQALILAPHLAKVGSILNGVDEQNTIEMGLTGNSRFLFDIVEDNIQIMLSVQNGVFYDLATELNKEPITTIKVDQVELMKELVIVRSFAKEEFNRATFTLTKESVKIFSQTPQVSDITRYLETKELEGKNNEVTLHIRQLAELVDTMDEGMVTLKVTNSAVIVSRDDNHFGLLQQVVKR